MDNVQLPTMPALETRPYQQRIIAQALDAFTTGTAQSILIESPTGSGKTVLGLLATRLLQDRLRLKAGWVAQRRHLLQQAQAENAQKGIHADLTFLSMFDPKPPTDLDLLVIDEFHHFGCSSLIHLINTVQPRFLLGLSATPYRTDKLQLSYDQVIRDAGITALIRDGYLSPYHHYTLPTYNPEAVVACYAREPQRWGRSLVYFHTLAQCQQAQALFQAQAIRAEVVTGSSDREAQLAAFRRGELDVLLNCLVLAEGLDLPELQTVFCRPSCRGLTVQMAGRALRTCPTLPIKQIVQCLHTRWPFPRTAPALLQFTWVDGSWRSLTENPQTEAVSRRTLHALAQTAAALPAFLTRSQGIARRRPRRLQNGSNPA